MATELEGKPLKFTAIFESKDAEMGMDAFLKKIQDINSKGVGNNANKAVNKASGQYQSILEGVTQSFGDFVNSNDRFYSAIAQSELGLQKVRNEQGMLNKELKDGIVTEQEYIYKTAQLNQMRKKLSDELKDNKAQLQQFNSTSQKTPAFTRQDTLNELASAHGSGATQSTNLSTTEAFAKATQESLNKLNAELVELDSKLKAGAISNEKYAKSTGEINNKLKEVQLNQEYFNANAGKNIVPTEEISKQKTALDAVSAKYREMVEDAAGAFQSISPKAQLLNNNLTSLKQESANLQAAQKELSVAFQAGDITQKQYLESSRNLAIQQNAVKSRIADTRQELARIDSAERKNIGSIAEMTARLTQMKAAYDKLSESQRNNINVGGKLRSQYQDLSNQVAKLNQEMAGTKSEGVGTALGSIRSIAASLGIAFGAQQLVAFGKELFNIAQEAEGVQIRFAKIGDTTGLEKLRAATLNTVSDLELMKQAIKADNFRIPMDVLAKGLEFATRRANETGESVEYLTQSFVTGLGRKSKLILDNLGISVTELNEEISRTGDFAKSVGNIIDREMAKSGDAVDTLAVKTGKLSAEWELLKLNVSKAFSAIFNPGLPDYTKIEKLTQSYKNGFDSIKGYGLTTSDAFIKDTEFMLKQVNSKLGELKKDSPVFEDIYNKQRGFGGKSPTQLLNDLRRPLVEQQQALQASLAYAQGITKELKIQDRQSKNIYSQSEIEEKLNEANTSYKNAIGDKQRAEAKKEVDKWQKLFDSVSIKANKTSDNKAKRDHDALAKEIAKDNKDREKLLEKWAETDAKYVNKQLSRNEQEVESVKKTYADIKKAIEEHNKTTKGEKTSLVGFDESVNKAVAGVKERQVLDKKLENYKLDYDNYVKYEELKKTVSEKYADEQFKDSLDATKNYYKNLNTEISKLEGKEVDGTITENEKQYLKERLKERKSFDQKTKEDEQAKYTEAYNTAKTHTQRLEDIEREYQQNIKALGNKASAEELANLKKLRDEKIKGENEEFFLKSDLYKKAAKEALIRTRQEIKEQIKAVEELLKTDLAPNIKDRLQKELEGLKINLSIGSVKTNISNLEKQRQDISNALSGYNTLNGISSITDQALDAHPELKKLYDQLNQVTDQIIKLKKETNDGSGGGFLGFLKKLEGNKALQEVSDWGNVAAQSFSEMSQALGGSETQAGYLLGTIGELAGAAADVAGAIASGDPKAIVKSVVGAVGSIISISRRTKEMNRQAREENKKFYDEAMKGERDYQALLRQRERESASRGKNSYNAIIAQLEAIKKQSPELQKAYDKVFSSLQGQDFIDGKGYQHGTWFRKAKTWDVMASLGGSDYNELEKLYSQGKLKDKAKEDFEALKALKEELEEAGLSVEDLQKSLNELLTGTSVSGLASGLADLFANGKRSAQDFGDSFESIMQNAIKSSFQAKFMEDAMQPFYEELAVMMEGGNLTGDQIQKLKDKYINLGEEYAKKWEDIEKVTGVDLSNKDKGSTGSLKNDIQAVTESTAGRLEAEFGGFRIAQLQTLAEVRSHGLTLSKQLEIANSNLVILNAIQVNTYRTAGNTDRLENIENALVSINNKVSSSDAARRGAGL